MTSNLEVGRRWQPRALVLLNAPVLIEPISSVTVGHPEVNAVFIDLIFQRHAAAMLGGAKPTRSRKLWRKQNRVP